MNIIIVGCGKVGLALAAELNEENNNVTVIDVNAQAVKNATDRYDVMGVVGNGATQRTLQEAGVENADLLIAVTSADELNLLCCMIAQKSANCQTIARIKNPEYSVDAPYLKDELGLAMIINPEYTAAEEIARVLRFPSAISIERFAKGKVELLKFRLPESSPVVGLTVREAMEKLKADFLVCTVERGDQAFIAKADFVFEANDRLSIVASPRNAYEFFKKIKHNLQPVKDAIVVGGGEIAHYLCDILQRTGIKLKVVESDYKVCEEFSVRHPEVTVIHADASDEQVLLEEGVENCGAFIAVSDLDEENIFLSLYARSKGDAKLVTKIDHLEHHDVIRSLNLDTLINPKTLTAESIVRYVRAMGNANGSSSVEALYSIIPGKAVATEFIVKENSPVCGVMLKDIKLIDNVLIAAILRGKEVVIPHGNDVICAGDTVVVVSEDVPLNDVVDILR